MTRQRGFTLIELLVVIAIIGILATLVVTQLTVARVKARNSSAQNDISEGGKSIEVFRNDDASANKVVDSGKATSGGSAGVNFIAPAATFNGTTGNGDATHGDFGYIFNGTYNTTTGVYSLDINKTASTVYTYTYVTCLKWTAAYPSTVGTSGSQADTMNTTGYVLSTNLDQTNGSGALANFWTFNSANGGGGSNSGTTVPTCAN